MDLYNNIYYNTTNPRGVVLLYRHLRPSMMQQLLRRLVFDVPMLSEYCMMALRVSPGLSY